MRTAEEIALEIVAETQHLNEPAAEIAAIVRTAQREAIEAAAKVCEDRFRDGRDEGALCAAAIRVLMPEVTR